MSAPAKATGGRKSTSKPGTTRPMPAPGSTAKRPPRGRLGGGGAASSEPSAPQTSVPRNNLSSRVPDNKRAEAIRSKAAEARSRRVEQPAPTGSSRPRILRCTAALLRRHGYVPLQVKQITAEAGISHQAFYGHFANKRDVAAKATSGELGAIVELAMKGARQPEPWAERLLADIDAALSEAYPAKNGPERRLRRRLSKAICSQGYEALRIKELVEVSRLGQGEFYRRYGGKRGCLRRIYAELLAELGEEVGRSTEQPLIALADRLATDRSRSKLLVMGSAHLPPGPETEPGLATRRSLPDFVAELVSTSVGGDASTEPARLIAGGVIEVIRSAVLGDRLDQLGVALAAFAAEPTGTAATDRGSVGLLAA